MWSFITGAKMQRLVCISTIFAILGTVDLQWNDSRWWCIGVLLLVLEYLAHNAGVQDSINNLLSMRKDKLMRLKDFMDSVENGDDRSEEELFNIIKKEEDEHK